MPPRSEEELDPVTLHNQALMNMEKNPADGFAKLQFLLAQNPFPPETFANLLLIYCKYEVRNFTYITFAKISCYNQFFQYYDMAADLLAENAHLTYKFLTQVCY